MYQPDALSPTTPAGLRTVLRSPARLHRNVWWLGVTSLLTDVSSEMVTAVLPLYLVAQHGIGPLAFGAVDGLHQGVSSLVRWLSGISGDRSGRHKEAAATGYAVSALGRVAWLVVSPAPLLVAGLVTLDRIGKGIRTAPRDALIALSTSSSTLGLAFGVHRALDAAGVMIGPLAAFALLSQAPARFDRVFAISLAAALAGLAALLLGTRNLPAPAAQASPAGSEWRTALSLLGDARFRPVVALGGGLALVTVSDPFLYLAIRAQQPFGAEQFPLLFAGTGLSYLLWSAPAGRLADRIGRGRVFMAGHAVLLTACLAAAGILAISPWLTPLLLGVYYASTDGVLAALASTRLPPARLGTGLALLGTATSLARLVASLTVGALWALAGPRPAILAMASALALVLAAIAALGHPVLRRTP